MSTEKKLQNVEPGHAVKLTEKGNSIGVQNTIFIRLHGHSSTKNVINTTSWMVATIDPETDVEDLGPLRLASQQS